MRVCLIIWIFTSLWMDGRVFICDHYEFLIHVFIFEAAPLPVCQKCHGEPSVAHLPPPPPPPSLHSIVSPLLSSQTASFNYLSLSSHLFLSVPPSLCLASSRSPFCPSSLSSSPVSTSLCFPSLLI